MLSNFIDSVKHHKSEIILAAIVALISLFSFSVGYLAGNYQDQQDIEFIQNTQQ